jgi:hypothetical protein
VPFGESPPVKWNFGVGRKELGGNGREGLRVDNLQLQLAASE